MAYLRLMHSLRCTLIATLILTIGIVTSLVVVHWHEETRRDAQISSQLQSLTEIYESAESPQDRYPIRALRKAVLNDTGTVDIWRADVTINRLYDWRRMHGIRQERPAVGWPESLYSEQFLNGQYKDKMWRAVQRLASHPSLGDVLIRVSRPREPFIVSLKGRSSEVAFVWLGLVLIGGILIGWAASKSMAPLEDLAGEVKQACRDDSISRLPERIRGREITSLVDSINTMLTKTQNRNQRFSSFASETAHELKTPLTSMRMIGELALRQPKDAVHLRESMGAVLEECQHMDQLIEGILLIAQAQSKRLAVAISRVDLFELATECVDRLKPLAEATGMTLNLQTASQDANPASLTLACDRALLRQAVVNLIHNAIVHNATGTQIEIRIESTDQVFPTHRF